MRNDVRWREQLLTSGHSGSSFILLTSFRDLRVKMVTRFCSRFLSRVFVITISSHLKCIYGSKKNGFCSDFQMINGMLPGLEISAGCRSLTGKISQFDRQISSPGGHA